jgi:hypothetical protein
VEVKLWRLSTRSLHLQFRVRGTTKGNSKTFPLPLSRSISRDVFESCVVLAGDETETEPTERRGEAGLRLCLSGGNLATEN